MEKKNTEWYVIKIVIVLVLLLAAFCFGRKSKKCKTLEPKPIVEYRTDTVWVPHPYVPSKPISNVPVKPKTVIVYQDSFKFERMKLIKERDSIKLILDTLKDSKPVLFNFLRDLDLSYDTLSLTLTDYLWKTSTYKYPLDLAVNVYQWRDYKLYRKEVPAVEVPEDKTHYFGNIYASGGYDVFKKVPLVGFMYNYDLGKFKLYSNLQSSITNKPDYYLNLNIGYKLK